MVHKRCLTDPFQAQARWRTQVRQASHRTTSKASLWWEKALRHPFKVPGLESDIPVFSRSGGRYIRWGTPSQKSSFYRQPKAQQTLRYTDSSYLLSQVGFHPCLHSGALPTESIRCGVHSVSIFPCNASTVSKHLRYTV